MNKTCFLPFLLVAAVSAVATADTYTNFLTGVSSVAPGGTPTAVGGEWTVPQGTSLSNVVGKTAFEFETQDESPESAMTLTVTAAPADTNTIVKLEMEVSVADVGDLMATLPEGAQTAFAVSTNAYNAWNGSAWVALDEVPAGIDDSQTTNLVVEIKYQGDVSSHKRAVRFSIGGTALQVRTNGSEWVELATTANNLAGLKVSGSGTFAKADASVMIGIAEYDGVKYGTLSNAVAAAEKDGLKETIEVLRKTTENVTLPDGAKIADNGNVKGEITVPDGKSIEVQPAVAEFAPSSQGVAVGTSGEYTVPVNVSGGTVNVKLPESMSNKEIVGTPTHSGTTISLTIQTASSVLAAAKPDNLAAPTNDISTLRNYLAAHTNVAYIAADASPETIKAALEATRENGLKLYQSYALGIPPTTSVKPVTVASDSDTSNITLSIPSLTSATPSGDYTIKYKVGDTEQSGASSIKIPLATGNTSVKIVLSDK